MERGREIRQRIKLNQVPNFCPPLGAGGGGGSRKTSYFNEDVAHSAIRYRAKEWKIASSCNVQLKLQCFEIHEQSPDSVLTVRSQSRYSYLSLLNAAFQA